MATTKKSSTRKTKTSGAKKAAKTSKKSVNSQAKTTVKKLETPSVEQPTEVLEKVSTKNKSKPVSIFKKLNDRNWMFALVYAASAVAVVIAGNEAYRTITTTFVTTDTLRVGQEPTYVQAIKTLFDLNLVYLASAVLGIGALTHLFAASIFRSRYESDLSRNTNRLRWLGQGLGDGLAIAGVGLLAGISDIATLAVVLFLVLVSTVVFGAVNGQFGGVHKVGRMVSITSILLAFAPWLIIGTYLLSASQYGTGFPLDYVWAMVGALFVANIAYLFVERMRRREKQIVADYANVEWMYMLIGFFLKAAFAGILFTEILR